MGKLTEILSNLDADDGNGFEQLLPLVYDELRMVAARKLSQENPGQTLQATALVHEVFLKLVKVNRWDSRRHFFAAAADAMRKILIDQARRKSAAKRGGNFERKDLNFCDVVAPERADELLRVDAAITELAKTNQKAAQVVKLRFFVGLTTSEAADIMGISQRSADRLWSAARSWLAVEIGVHND